MPHPRLPDLSRATTTVAFGMGLLLLLALWLLWPGVRGPFIFDDFPYLENLRKLGGDISWPTLGMYLASYDGPFGRALSMASFLLNDHAWPSTPDTFKRTNLLIHLLNGVVVFGLARSLALTRFTAVRAAVVAMVAMAIWLLHPIQVSAVFLTVQRITMLSALWVFAALWAYVALLRRASDLRGSVIALLALAAFTTLGVLSKENAVLAFLFAAVLNATLLAPRLGALPARARWLLHAGTLGPILLAVAAIAFKWPEYGDYSLRDFTPLERLMTEGRVLVDYAWRILQPRPMGSGIFNDDYIVSRGLLDPPATLFATMAIAALLASAVALRRCWPLYALAVLWFFAGHLIESTVISLELYFEHRNYVPVFGLAFALAAGAVAASGKLRNVYRAALGAWLLMMVFNTTHQARLWGNPSMMAVVWASEHPDSVRARQFLADYHYRFGEVGAARAVLADALDRGLAPATFSTQLILLDCVNSGEVSPQLVRQATSALRTDLPYYSTSQTLRDIRIRIQTDQCPQSLDLDRWLALTDAALANPRRKSYEAFLQIERSYAFTAKRDLAATMDALERAYTAKPEVEMTYMATQSLVSAGLHDAALEWLERGRTLPISPWRAWLTQRTRVIDRLQCDVRQLREPQVPLDCGEQATAAN